MITVAKKTTPKKIRNTNKNFVPARHEHFLTLLPRIRQYAQFAFRGWQAEAREEAVQQVICSAWQAYCRLVELNKGELAYASPLARYGVARARVERQVGSRHNSKDVLSCYAGRKHGFTVERFDRCDQEQQLWQELILEDRHAGPAEVAGCRIDFQDWLKTLDHRQRKIAALLAGGESTTAAAKAFGVSCGRISQVRRALATSWRRFQDDR